MLHHLLLRLALGLVELEHQGALNEVRQGGSARVVKHGLEEREDALGARGVGCHGKHDARRGCPRRELVAVVAPEEQDGVGEGLRARRVDQLETRNLGFFSS